MASLTLLLVGFLVLAAAGEMVMEEEELLGLYNFLDSLLDDPAWAQMHPQPCTDTPWPGVECEVGDQNPSIFHVTKIHIGPDILTPPCKSSAKLSESLTKLPHLRTLSLFNCFTSSSQVSISPSFFGAFSSLEHLALKSNPGLSGPIPPSLAEVVGLRVLCLSQNNLHGEIPKEIGENLMKLEQLDLSYNNFTGSIPQEIGGLKSLTILDLSFNCLVGQLPSSLGQLQLLHKIDLSSNKLRGRVPPDLGQLKRLVLVDMSHNYLTGPLPETLCGLQQLEYLIIEDNPINTGMPLFIGILWKLKVLGFSGCGLTGPILTSLSSLENLTALSLNNNSLNGTIPPILGTLPCLDELNLSQNQLSGEVSLPEEFINRLGNRLNLDGNNGLCTKQQQHDKANKSFTLIQIPSCLGTRLESSNKSRPDELRKVKPTWYKGNISSDTIGLEGVVFPCFVVWFICFLLLF